jgi:hypothetical protein
VFITTIDYLLDVVLHQEVCMASIKPEALSTPLGEISAFIFEHCDS